MRASLGLLKPVQVVGVPKEKRTVLALVDPSVASLTSQDIADLVGSRHQNVVRAIERLADRAVIQLTPMEYVQNSNGQTVGRMVFSGEQGKRDSIIVVTQLSPEFTAQLIDRWQELLTELAKAVSPQGDGLTMSAWRLHL